MKTYYDILGVSRTATSLEIKKAFRDKAKIYHPDISESKDAHQIFVKIAEAYNILKDSNTRAEYDRHLIRIEFNSKTAYNKDNESYSDSFRKSTQQARSEAEEYATITLDELLIAVLGFTLNAGKSFFFGGDNKPKSTFFDYLLMGFLGFLLTFSIILSFTGIGTLPGIVMTVAIINTIFKSKRFIGFIPFLICTFILNTILIIFLVILVLNLR